MNTWLKHTILHRKIIVKNLAYIVFISVLVVNIKLQAYEITSEELLFLDIPIVVSAARKEQLITEAPATINVITAEDIRFSGHTSIAEIIRSVPGVDIMSISKRNKQIGIRGFTEFISNKVLVYIDGRSAYWDGYEDFLCDMASVSLEEIKQIEIIRGPTSSLYGANAYCGIINIITRAPEDIDGTEIKLTSNGEDILLNSVLHAKSIGKASYKVSGLWNKTNEWEDFNDTAGEVRKGNALVKYQIRENEIISISGGINRHKDKRFFAREDAGSINLDGDYSYLQLDYNFMNLKFRSFIKTDDIMLNWIRTNEEGPLYTQAYDTEFQYSANIRDIHAVVFGANYRHNTVKQNDLIPENYSQDLWAIFIENNSNISDRLSLTLGGRYDRHPLINGQFSPRVSLTHKSINNRTIRLTVSQAFRTPTYIDSYVNLTKSGTQDVSAYTFPYTYTLTGNMDLKPEVITSYELGYNTNILNSIYSKFNLFYNRYSNFFSVNRTMNLYSASELLALGLPVSYAGLLPKEINEKFVNGGNARGIGGELELNISISRTITGMFNYSYNQITDKNDNLTTSINEKDSIRQDYPKNKINAGFKAKFDNGISTYLMTHWVDKTARLINDIEGVEHLAEIDAYTTINTRVGYTFLDNRAELSIAIFNLFDNKHYEYPVGVNLPDNSSEKVEREITGTMSYNF